MEWYERLKEARLKKGLTQKQVCENLMNGDNITIQSLVSYENGKKYPKTNVLKKLCTIYDVSSDYIIFGNKNNFLIETPNSDTLLNLFMLIYSKKIEINENEIIVNDLKLRCQLKKINIIAKYIDISNINQIKQLIDMINDIN